MTRNQLLSKATKLARSSGQLTDNQINKLRRLDTAKLQSFVDRYGGRSRSASKPKAASAPESRSKSKSRSKPVDRTITGKVGKTARARAEALKAAIRSGKIQPIGGIRTPSDFGRGTHKEKVALFLEQYKGVSLRGKTRRATSRRMSPKARFNALAQQAGWSGFPYYLAPGKTIRVGGGASGPGVVRAIPGSKAPPFHTLTVEDQRKIVAFLNGPGKTLRGRGAKREASSDLLRQGSGARKAPKYAKPIGW